MTDSGERIKRIVENDTKGHVNDALAVAQADVLSVLVEFMDVEKLDMSVKRDGEKYKLFIQADVNEIYDVGAVSGKEV